MNDSVDHNSARVRRGTLVIVTAVIVVMAIVGVLLGTEAFLQSRNFEGYYVWYPHMAQAFSPLPGILPGVHGDSRFSTNAAGIRGRDFASDDDRRVLAFGGSTTECLYLDDSEAWPRLLEHNLNERPALGRVWVGNVGKSGLSTRNHIEEVKVLLRQYPKVDTILLSVGLNDLLLRLSRDKDWAFTPPDHEPRDRLFESSFAVVPEPDEPVYTFPEIRRRLGTLKERTGADKTAQQWMFKQDTRAERCDDWRKRRQMSLYRLSRVPDMSSALEEFRMNLNAIIDAAGDHSVRVVFVTQPSMWKAGMTPYEEALLWMGGVGRFQESWNQPYYTPETLATWMAKYNEELIGVCQARSVECVDLAAVIPKDTTALYDDCHFNENGSRMVAAALADYFELTDPPNDR